MLRYLAIAVSCGALLPAMAPSCLGEEQAKLNDSLLSQAGYGNAQEVADLLDQGADPNARRSPGGQSALQLAAGDGETELVRLLLDAKADVNAKDDSGRSPLSAAAGSRRASIDLVKELLQEGAKVDDEAVKAAAGDLPKLTLLLDSGGQSDAAVMNAVLSRNFDCLRLLIERGAEVNQKAPDGGYTPLHLGGQQGGPEVVELLLKHRADPNVQDAQGATPLHAAVAGDGDIRVVRLLVAAGAKLDVANEEGQTPVRLASLRGNNNAYRFLLEKSGGKEPKPARAPWLDQGVERSVAQLAAHLQSKNPDVRQRATKDLSSRGAEVMPEILRLIEAGTPAEIFYETFMAMGPAAEGAIPLLAERLKDKAQVFGALRTMHAIKPAAFAALPAEQQQQAADALYEVVVDPKSDVMAGFAATMLLSLGEPAAPAVVKLLESENPGIRKHTLRKIEQLKFSSPIVVDAVKRLAAEDEHPEIRTVAARVLQASGDKQASADSRAVLLEIFERPPPPQGDPRKSESQQAHWNWSQEASEAGRALGRLGPDAIDDLLPFVTPQDNPHRIPALEGFKSLDQRSLSRLLTLLASDDEELVNAARIGLVSVGAAAIPELTTRVSSSDQPIAVRAAVTLGLMHGRARGELPMLLAVAGDAEKPAALRTASARAALSISPEVARKSPEVVACVPLFLKIVETGAQIERSMSLRTLAEIGPAAREALPKLQELRQAPPKDGGQHDARMDRILLDEAIRAIEAKPARRRGAAVGN